MKTSYEVLSLYFGLCAEAGPVYQHYTVNGIRGVNNQLCAEAGPVYQQARRDETTGAPEHTVVRDSEVSVPLNELQQLRAIPASR